MKSAVVKGQPLSSISQKIQSCGSRVRKSLAFGSPERINNQFHNKPRGVPSQMRDLCRKSEALSSRTEKDERYGHNLF